MHTGSCKQRKQAALTRARSTGFAYVLLLITVATLGMLSAASLSLGAQITRRDAERELLAIGAEFEQALRSYGGIAANAEAATGGRGPRTLEELLKDPRSLSVKRHLRQIYADPLTGRNEWGLVKEPGGSIVGIYSIAEGVPIQRAGFEPAKTSFENAESYAAWVFGFPGANRPNNQRTATGAAEARK